MLLTALLALALTSCAGDEDINALVAELNPPVNFRYHVSASTGADTNDGSPGSPFRTLKQALSVAVAGDAIKVLPGVYNVALGEVFPLNIPANVSLHGDEATKGNGAPPTSVVGAVDTALFNVGDSVLIAGLDLQPQSSLGPFARVADVNSNNLTFRNNTATGASAASGLWLWGSGHRVVGSQFLNLTEGLVVVGGPGNLVTGNVFKGNGVGVSREAGAMAVFGGGGLNSPGLNVFSCNTTTDLRLYGGTASARNNIWDHLPPSSAAGTGGSGVDIALASSATLPDVTGAMLVSGACL